MVFHHTSKSFCNSNFQVVKVDKEIFNNQEQCKLIEELLQKRFDSPIYFTCEESTEKVRGEVEWIRGYISMYEVRWEFDVYEISLALI